MKYYLGILLLLITSCVTYGQTLKGVVADGETGTPLSSVTIVNINTQESAYSNENGEFTIRAKTGEQIIFSYLGYKTTQRSMPASIGVATARIEMFRLNYQLGEVIVTPGQTPYQLDSARRRSTYSRALERQKVTSVMSPISFLADRISGRSKQIYNFQKNFNKWEGERFVDSRYTPETVTRLTGLTGDSLAAFMNANPMPHDYARTATELELQMWIRYNYKQWMKNPVIPPHVVDTMK